MDHLARERESVKMGQKKGPTTRADDTTTRRPSARFCAPGARFLCLWCVASADTRGENHPHTNTSTNETRRTNRHNGAIIHHSSPARSSLPLPSLRQRPLSWRHPRALRSRPCAMSPQACHLSSSSRSTRSAAHPTRRASRWRRRRRRRRPSASQRCVAMASARCGDGMIVSR